jgi:replication factor C small subunit
MNIIQPFDNKLFTEKYRPNNIEDFILPKRIISIFSKDNNIIIPQNFLFYGTPGLGKTSLAKFLANHFDYLYLNVSSETGIDIVRNNISEYCSSVSMYSDLKVVLLDEMDGASGAFYKALRATMEQYHDCRFIGTCNYINKIPDAIKSRFELINFNFTSDSEIKECYILLLKRIKNIIESEGLTITKDGLEQIKNKIIYTNFPDIRKIINIIQILILKNDNKKQITKEDVDLVYEQRFLHLKLYEFILDSNKTNEEVYSFVKSYLKKYSIEDVFVSLGSMFIDYLREQNIKDIEIKLAQLVFTFGNHQFQKKFAIEELITLMSLIFEYRKILCNKK